MTHRQTRVGRRIHPETTIWLRRNFTLLTVLLVLVGIFPPLILIVGPLVAWVIIRKRRALVAQRPTERERIIARGNREF